MKNLHINLCNKIGLHKCSKSYCLRLPKKKTDDDVNGKKTNMEMPRACRFHYGTYDDNLKTSSGKDLHPFDPLITTGEHPRFKGR